MLLMNLLKSNFAEYMAIEAILSEDSKREVLTIRKPEKCAGVELPGNLNDLSIGALLMLQESAKDAKMMHRVVADAVLGVKVEKLYNEKAYHVIGLINFVCSEVGRINRLFAGIGHNPTPQEERAGYRELNFGAFGIIDWYARRSNGRFDHNEAAAEKWVSVYRAMEHDGKLDAFRDRLSKIMDEEAKLKAKKR